MEISGKIIADLQETSGQGRNGMWRSKDYVLETQEQYPKKVCFNLFGDRIDKFPLTVGDEITVSFDIESREYNGRWYTSIRAWKVEKQVADTPQILNESAPMPTTPPPAVDNFNVADDLPF